MCDLAATGTDSTLLIVLAAAFLLAGAFFFRKARAGAAAVLLVLILAGSFGAPTPAVAADCNQTAPPVVQQAVLSVSVTQLPLDLAAPTGSFVVTNVSPVNAFDVSASSVDLPPGMAISTITCPATLVAGSSCRVDIAGDGTSPAFTSTVRVAGSNTNVVLVTVEGKQYALLAAAPNPMLFLGDGTQDVVITNASAFDANISGIAAPTEAAITIDSSTCSAVLNSLTSCVLTVTFASANTSGGDWNIIVEGNFPTLTIGIVAAI